MIKVKKGVNGEPISTPENAVARIFDGTDFLFFETIEEKENYIKDITVFSLETWKAETNALHNQLFESYYLPLKYEGEDDIALTALNSAKYAQEALSLAKWRNDTFDIIEAVTEQQAQQTSPQEFINSLPLFNV
jgi:hypothetical protein